MRLHRTCLCLLPLLLVAGCASSDGDDNGSIISAGGQTVVDVKAYRGLAAGDPIEVAGVDQVLVPLGVRLNQREAKRSLRRMPSVNAKLLSGAQSYFDSADPRRASADLTTSRQPHTNLVIFSPATGESRLLLDGRGLVTQLVYESPPQPEPELREPPGWLRQRLSPEALAAIVQQFTEPPQSTWPAGLVLVGLASQDADSDRLLTADDPARCFALSLSDGTLRPLTPADDDWTGWRFNGDKSAVFLRTRARPSSRPVPEGAAEDRLYRLDLETLAVVPLLPEALVEEAVRAAGVDLK